MPEGPEISYMTHVYHNKFKNTMLEDIEILGGRYSRHPLPDHFSSCKEKLPSLIIGIYNKGKFIYMRLKDNYIIGIKLNFAHLIEKNEKHSNIRFKTSKGDFYIEDKRNFGTIVFPDKESLKESLSKIGPDLIHESISFDEFNQVLLKHPRTKIGHFLIEQKYFSGVGNYIRSEVLYESCISPFRLVGDLSIEEKERLFKDLIHIIHKALELLIKSNRKYTLKIYQKKTTPKGEDIKAERLECNRNIYWVPSSQK